MTRIILHPDRLPRHGRPGAAPSAAPVALGHPWRWWGLRLRPYDGVTYRQEYDGALFGEPGSRDTVTEMRLVFDEEHDYDIVDPPALRLTTIAAEYDDRYAGVLARSLMTSSESTECAVVWNEQPGERWQELPGNTCHPGDFQIRTMDRFDLDRFDDDTHTRLFAPDMPVLGERFPPEQLQFPREQVVLSPTGIMVRAALTEAYQRIMDSAVVAAEGFQRFGAISAGVPGPPGPVPHIHVKRKRYSPNVLPESDVVDEIDRLTNDQLRNGPVDDYNCNRYPKCVDCSHDWHGLECADCDCLNTNWLDNSEHHLH